MSDTETNKETIQNLIQTVWREGDLAALPDFWTVDCINHAMAGPDNQGLSALVAYHRQFMEAFSAFSNATVQIEQQVAEGDRVVTQVTTNGLHSGPFLGIPATGRSVTMGAIRIDRLQGGKIAEHWSVSDLAGLMQQLQA